MVGMGTVFSGDHADIGLYCRRKGVFRLQNMVVPIRSHVNRNWTRAFWGKHGTVWNKVRLRLVFMVIRHPKLYTLSAQKTRKHFLKRAFCYFTLSEMVGGGCCQNNSIRWIRVYILITPFECAETSLST